MVIYKNDSFLIYEEPWDDDDYANYDSVVLEHDSEDGRLLIRYSLVKTISDMFGLSLTEARVRIKDWFENENGLIVKFFYKFRHILIDCVWLFCLVDLS